MEDETRILVDAVEQAARVFHDEDPIEDVRELWNWRDDGDDADVEITIGQNASLRDLVEQVETLESWTIRFMGTCDVNQMRVPIAFIHHPERNVRGVTFSQ